MSTEVILKINSYYRNIKFDASRDKLSHQHFQKALSLLSTPVRKLQIAIMKSAFQPSTISQNGSTALFTFL